MSNARPMGHVRRLLAYTAQADRPTLTPRQQRQYDRMGHREWLHDVGALPHGASGVRLRRPHPHARGGAR